MVKLSRSDRVFLGLFFAVITLLACLFPLSGDDWQWGLAGLRFTTFNGRFLGNTGAIVLTHFHLLRPLVKGLSVSFIAFSLVWLTGARGGMLLSVPALLLLPTVMFTQNYQWTAGFTNFTLPAAILLLTLMLATLALNSRRQPARAALMLASAVTAFLSQFCAEHTTIMATVTGVAVTVFLLARRSKASLAALFPTIGACAGAAVMFSNNAYTAEGNAGAHAMPALDNLLPAFKTQLFALPGNILFNNIVLLFILSAVIIALVNSTKDRFSTPLSAFFTIVFTYSLVRTANPILLKLIIVNYLEVLLLFTFAAALIFAVFHYISDSDIRFKLTALAVALAFANAPLLITHSGARTFFISYVILLFSALYIYSYLREKDAVILPKQVVTCISAVLFCAVCTLFLIYGHTALQVSRRNELINTQLAAGNDTIIVLKVDYSEHNWQINPITDYVGHIFKLFHGIGEDVTIVVK